MKKRWVFNKLDFHLGFMKITMEIIMEKWSLKIMIESIVSILVIQESWE